MVDFAAKTTKLPWHAGSLVEDLMQVVILFQELVVIPPRVKLPWIADSLVVHIVEGVDTDMPPFVKPARMANSLFEKMIWMMVLLWLETVVHL
ncbi:hypothetical protein GOBAR_DD29741 [Gossypium barbadense]|nr:hypothetical protein GOBAR_DD29741 [Gossypium barbadense]